MVTVKVTGPALIVAAALSILAGCAGIDVGYPETIANPSLLAAVAPRRVSVEPIFDRRMDQTRIGARPSNGDAIVTRRPVPDIVREALIVELTANGHSVVATDGDVHLAADVEEFWLDTASRGGRTQYVGRVALALAVRDARTGTTLLTRRYAGLKRLQAKADSRDAWREAMDSALARAVRDLATDPDLVAALGRSPGPRGRAGAAAVPGRAGDL